MILLLFLDVPVDFRVSIFKDSINPAAVFNSKAIGEPPLFLGSTVYFAIREAITSYRNDDGLFDWFQFNSPATTERIRMACVDKISSKFVDKDFQAKGSY